MANLGGSRWLRRTVAIWETPAEEGAFFSKAECADFVMYIPKLVDQSGSNWALVHQYFTPPKRSLLNTANCHFDTISTSLATVFMLRAVPIAAA
jgi:hypothetical protein